MVGNKKQGETKMLTIKNLEDVKHLLAYAMASSGVRFGKEWRHAEVDAGGEEALRALFYELVGTVELNRRADALVEDDNEGYPETPDSEGSQCG